MLDLIRDGWRVALSAHLAFTIVIFGNACAGPTANGLHDVVGNFDFSKVDVRDDTKNDYLHLGLAPSYGKISAESVRIMDRELKTMITGTMHALEKERRKGVALEWDSVMAAMMQNTLVEPFGEEVVLSDRLIEENTDVFALSGSPDAATVKQVQSWFVHLVSDPDVVESTGIDVDVMASIVAQTGATMTSLHNIFYGKEEHEKTLVDVGVLRFPDVSRPYFKVYRIKLVAWSQCERVGPVQFDKNGIIGKYTTRNFRPRKEVMRRLSEEIMAKATAEAEELLAP